MSSESSMKGITVIEIVVIAFIIITLLSIAIPKLMEAMERNKMWDGMSTLMTYESAQLAYLAQYNRLGSVDSLIFHPVQSKYFSVEQNGIGRFKAVANMKIGRFKKGSWLHTSIDTTGGMPRINRSCSKGDSMSVKRYITGFFSH